MSPITDVQHVRLEVLKIAHRPDKDEETNIKRCKALTEFVIGGEDSAAKAKPAKAMAK